MTQNDSSDKKARITPDMTVLDVIHRFRETEAVFRRYDHDAGECICCTSLFETVADVAKNYGIHLEEMLAALRHAAS
ncbi:MAG: hypothetical protein R6T92_05125 [Desulfosalsimonadaceae bacterium]